MKRSAEAIWKGTIKEGNGKISLESGLLKDAQYSYKTRFEEGKGTNPEELIAAAHAGCFTMKVSGNFSEHDFKPEKLDTKCEITFKEGKVAESHLILTAKVPGIEQEKFDELVQDAKENCPLSQLLDTKITLSATLEK